MSTFAIDSATSTPGTNNQKVISNIPSPAPEVPFTTTDPSTPLKTNSINSFQIPHEETNSVTDVTEANKNENPEIISQIKELAEKLGAFNPTPTEENKNQIFFLDKEGNVTLGNNEMETFNVSDLTAEASHEAAKEQFLKLITDLFGEEAANDFYPATARETPLTTTLSSSIIKNLLDFSISIANSCQGDLSQYETQLHAQLALKKIEPALASPRQATPEEASMIDALSKYTKIPPPFIYAGMLTAGVLAASSFGPALLPLVHNAVTLIALSHSSSLSAALASGAPHSTTVSTLYNTATAAAHNPILRGAITGQIAGAVGGLAIGHALDPEGRETEPVSVMSGLVLGTIIGTASGAYSPALFQYLLSSLGYTGMTVATTLGTGAALGGSASLVRSAIQAHQTQQQTSPQALMESITHGAGSGAILSGLSLAFGAAIFGSAAFANSGAAVLGEATSGSTRMLGQVPIGAAVGAAAAGIRSMATATIEEPQETLLAVAQGAAIGAGSALAGGLCCYLAHYIAGLNPLHTHVYHRGLVEDPNTHVIHNVILDEAGNQPTPYDTLHLVTERHNETVYWTNPATHEVVPIQHPVEQYLVDGAGHRVSPHGPMLDNTLKRVHPELYLNPGIYPADPRYTHPVHPTGPC